jgi:FMN phosphatase YigB (HAD superfamily)
MKLNHFDNIIFDLGGVILNIDYHKTAQAFQNLGLENFDEIYSQAQQSGLFDDFETGKISGQYFINQLLKFLPKNVSPNEVVAAWNAMILDFPLENLNLLRQLKISKNCVLLSNTNEIHVQCFNRKLKDICSEENLHPFFKKVYFSHEIGQRKPHISTFDFVCRENNFIPEQTVFIDDSFQHIEGANKMGLKTYFLQKGDKLVDLF